MSIKTLFIDLDDTVYPAESGIWHLIGERINQYMIEQVHIPADGISELREQLFHVYGTTMRGLVNEYKIDARDYLAFVHDIPLENYLQPNLALYQALKALPFRKVIFTNADTNHAMHVLKTVGIDSLIDQVIDILMVSPYCKPQKESFQKALESSGDQDPTTIAYFDDNVENLAVARQMGFYTVKVGRKTSLPGCSHASIQELSDIHQIFNHSETHL
jgi:pyrimidine 5'-nucleotidase